MRFFRRIGGAVVGALSGTIALADLLRRPAAPKTRCAPPKPRASAAPPAARRPRTLRQPTAAAPATPPRETGWFARWFGRKPPQPDAPALAHALAPAEKPATRRRRARKSELFSPETHPGLSAEDCAFLNTPLGECDPQMVQRLLAALAQGIAGAKGAELGMDADALFAQFCGRLFVTPDAAAPDASAAAPGEAPETTDSAATEDQAATEPPMAADETKPADAPIVDPPIVSLYKPFFLSNRLPIGLSRSTPPPSRPVARRRSNARRSRAGIVRSSSPPRRLFYAACAGPP